LLAELLHADRLTQEQAERIDALEVEVARLQTALAEVAAA
jgi:hypothetical protein